MIEPRIIVLEDDDELRSIVGRGLREEGFEVSTLASAAELMNLTADAVEFASDEPSHAEVAA